MSLGRGVLVALLMGVAGTTAALGACESRDIATPNVALSFYMEKDGKALDQDSGTVDSNAGQLRLHVVVTTAGEGQWPVSLTLTGALAFLGGGSGADGGTFLQSTVPAGSATTDLAFPVQVIAPRGAAFVTGTIGRTVASTTLWVNPSTPFISMCVAQLDRGCSPPANAGASDAATPTGDAEILAVLPPLAPDMWSMGDVIPLRLGVPSLDAGVDTRTVHMRTSGSLAIGPAGGAMTATEDDMVPLQVDTLWRTLSVVSTGPGRVVAWMNEGQPQTMDVRAIAPSMGVTEIRPEGILASNTLAAVGMCSTFSSGSLVVGVSAGLFGDGGVVTVSPAMAAECPTGYRGRVAGTWLGAAPTVTWTLLDPKSGAASVQTLPMDGIIEAASAALVSADGGSPGWEPPSDAGDSSARVTVAFFTAQDGGLPAPIVGSGVTVVGDPSVQATIDPPATTAADGTVTVLLSAPPSMTSLTLTFRLDGRLSVTLLVPGPA